MTQCQLADALHGVAIAWLPPTAPMLRIPYSLHRAPAQHLWWGRVGTVQKSCAYRLPKHFAGCTLESGQDHRMDTLDYVLLIGGILVFIFTIVMDVLLVREWIQKRTDKQKPPQRSDT
jgi:hypothetical protein